MGLFYELQAGIEELFVNGLHALGVERTGVLDLLCAIRHGPAVEHTARPKLLFELGVLGVVGALGLLFGIEVVEITEKLVESVCRGQELVPVPEVVLSELPGDITQRFEEVGDGGVLGTQTEVGARQPYFGEAGADGRLAGDERSSAGSAALL